MGCCISKCSPDKQYSLESDQFNLQDKLVISQAPPTPKLLLYSSNNKLVSSSSPNYPPSPTSSVSSFTCTTNSNSNSNSNNSTTLSSASSFSSSASSSTLTSKVDRSFSNEFLWSCYKENPHIITRINSLKDPTSLLPCNKPNKPPQSRKIANPPSLTNKQSSPSPQKKKKRVRSNSPTNLTRQKSFRKEPLRPPILSTINSASSNVVSSSRIMLGSPSPTRRFNASNHALATNNTSVSRRTTIINSPKVSSTNVGDHYSRSIRKEDVKAASPNNMMSLRQQHLHSAAGLNLKKHRETVVKDLVSRHDNHMDSTMEDIDNPHISLDCFIFL